MELWGYVHGAIYGVMELCTWSYLWSYGCTMYNVHGAIYGVKELFMELRSYVH